MNLEWWLRGRSTARRMTDPIYTRKDWAAWDAAHGGAANVVSYRVPNISNLPSADPPPPPAPAAPTQQAKPKPKPRVRHRVTARRTRRSGGRRGRHAKIV